uniref:Peroxin/Ferlin domain-containing protein n=1 Tax=Caenorhabditis tropicalis TaxID=1561998 RepID=A0A1I7U7Q0_9PELO
MDDKIEIVTRVITFFFPYDSKVEEYENKEWYPGDPRDYSQGHPNGHEMWGHGQIGWWQKDEKGWHWYWDDASDLVRTTYPPNVAMPSTTRGLMATTSSPSSDNISEYSDSLLAVVLAFYALLLLISFASNILLANVIKKYRWVGSLNPLSLHSKIAGHENGVALSSMRDRRIAVYHQFIAPARQRISFVEEAKGIDLMSPYCLFGWT